jgi:serine/threonine protein phosphatase PrpC
MTALAPSGKLKWAALSDQGRRRKNNEDAMGAWALGEVLARMPEDPRVWPAHGFLLVVSDGMGGAKAGEVASQFCVSRIGQELFARRREPNREAALREAFVVTHEALMTEAEADPEKDGMGATLSVLWLLPGGEVVFGHVGDSRIYAKTGGNWRQLTEDQSVGAGMVRRGEMAAEDVNRLRYRSMLEQVMGGDGAPLEPQIGSEQWLAGSAYGLCSDGLYGPLGDELGEYWRDAFGRPTLQAGTQWLIDQANEAGGPDNITVLLARFVPEGKA